MKVSFWINRIILFWVKKFVRAAACLGLIDYLNPS